MYGNELFFNDNYVQEPKLLNNLVLNYNLKNEILFKASFDLIHQKINSKDVIDSSGSEFYYGGFFTTRIVLNEKLSVTGRFEFSNDQYQLKNQEFENISYEVGFTLGAEYKPNPNSYLRLEGRTLEFRESNHSTNPFDSRLESIFTFGVYF